MIDLGWANGWGGKRPPEYQKCLDLMGDGNYNPTPEQAAHRKQITIVKLGRSAETKTCAACNIKWSVDTGD